MSKYKSVSCLLFAVSHFGLVYSFTVLYTWVHRFNPTYWQHYFWCIFNTAQLLAMQSKLAFSNDMKYREQSLLCGSPHSWNSQKYVTLHSWTLLKTFSKPTCSPRIMASKNVHPWQSFWLLFINIVLYMLCLLTM